MVMQAYYDQQHKEAAEQQQADYEAAKHEEYKEMVLQDYMKDQLVVHNGKMTPEAYHAKWGFWPNVFGYVWNDQDRTVYGYGEQKANTWVPFVSRTYTENETTIKAFRRGSETWPKETNDYAWEVVKEIAAKLSDYDKHRLFELYKYLDLDDPDYGGTEEFADIFCIRQLEQKELSRIMGAEREEEDASSDSES